MKRNLFHILVYFVALFALGAAAFLILQRIATVPDTIAAILSGGLTLAASYVFTRQGEIEATQRAQKIAAYNHYSKTIFNQILIPAHKSIAANAEFSDYIGSDQIVESFMQIGEGITVWGGDKVVAAYANFFGKFTLTKEQTIQFDIFDECAMLFIAMREDLGYENNNLSRNDLRCIFGFGPCERVLKQVESASSSGQGV